MKTMLAAMGAVLVGLTCVGAPSAAEQKPGEMVVAMGYLGAIRNIPRPAPPVATPPPTAKPTPVPTPPPSPPAPTPAPVAFDFSLTNGGTVTLPQSYTGVTMITASLLSGSAQTVSLSASGWPSGVTASFSQGSCALPCFSALTMTTSSSAAAGSYPITVTAGAAGLSRSTTFTVTVTAATLAPPVPKPPATPTPPVTVPTTPPAASMPLAPPPTSTTPPGGQASPVGYLDVIAADSRAYGWSYDPDVSSQSNTVEIYVDGPAGSTSGIFGGQANADRPRPDVNKVRSVSGNHGFDWPIPARFLDGKSHSLYVYGVDLTGNANKALNGSPMVFTSPGSAPPALTPMPTVSPTPTPTPTAPTAQPSVAQLVPSGQSTITVLSGDPAGTVAFARAHWISSTNKMITFLVPGFDNSVRAFDPVTNNWEYLWPNSGGTTGIQARDNYASFYIPRLNELWVWGGSHLEDYVAQTGNKIPVYNSGRFSISQKQWITKSESGSGAFAGVLAGNVVFTGADPAAAWNAQLDMGLFCCGAGNSVSGDFYIIEPNTSGSQPYKVSQLTGQLPPARAQAMNLMVAGGTNFYLFGGYTGQVGPQNFYTTDFWKFDGINRSWTRLADPPAVGYQSTVSYDSDKNMVVAWVDDHIYVYDIVSGQWNDRTPAGLPCIGNQVGVYSTTAKAHLFTGGNRCSDGGSTGPQVYAISFGAGSIVAGSNPAPAFAQQPASAPAVSSPQGYFDSVADGTLSGWTYDPDSASQSNDVEIYIDGAKGSGTLLAKVTANGSRPDVNAARGITGNHGFSYSIPQNYRNGVSHSYYVYGVDKTGNADGHLTNSPRSITLGTSSTPPPAPPTPAPVAPVVPVVPSPAPTVTPTTPSTPPVAGWLNIPLRTWVSRPYPPATPDTKAQAVGQRGFGPSPFGSGLKHQRLVYNSENKRVYFYSGDFNGGPQFNGGLRSDMYSYDITKSVTSDPSDLQNWTVEWPFCGFPGQISPTHTDEAPFSWDSKRHVFWITGGYERQSEDTVSKCNNGAIFYGSSAASATSEGNAPHGGDLLQFDPARNRYIRPDTKYQFPPSTVLLPGAQMPRHSTYNPVKDEIIMMGNDAGGNFAARMNAETGVWTRDSLPTDSIDGGYINDGHLIHEQLALDVENQFIYVIDTFHKRDPDPNHRFRLFRYDLTRHNMTSLGWIPFPLTGNQPNFCGGGYDGCTQFPYYVPPFDSTMLVYDSINKVVLWPASSNTGRPILMIYHPDPAGGKKGSWEIDPMNRDKPGEVVYGSNGTFIPELNVMIMYGGFGNGSGDPDTGAVQNYFWLYRYGNGK